MATLLISYGADREHAWTREMARQMGMEYLLDYHGPVVKAKPRSAFAKELSKEFMPPFWKEVADRSAVLTVAMIRLTGSAPQPRLMTNLILEYCPLGVTQWPIETV